MPDMICYSINDEEYKWDDFGSFLDDVKDDAQVGDIYYEHDAVAFSVSDFIRVDDILEMFDAVTEMIEQIKTWGRIGDAFKIVNAGETTIKRPIY